MNDALKHDLNWFWYYWLWTTESVDGAIEAVKPGALPTVIVRQHGQMPSPIVLKLEFAKSGPALKPPSVVKMLDETTALVTFPVDVWFRGERTYEARLNFGGRALEKVTLDPYGRFPDRDPSDNVWPRK
jgi:hypothetical protein